MGQAKVRKRAHASVLADGPSCIYCTNRADTIEHMPPVSMFWNRDRPKGLEFPCCEACNQATKHSDLVAALIGRLYPNAPSELGAGEVTRMLRAIRNNVPGLLEEMDVRRGAQKLAAKRYGIDLSNGGGFVHLGGPIATKHMTTFAAKLGFALFHECHGAPVPPEGIVRPIYYSNVQAMSGELPKELIDVLPPEAHTLRAGKKHVAGQFEYVWRTEPAEGVTIVFATFRGSFAAGAIIYHDRASLQADEMFEGAPLFVRSSSSDFDLAGRLGRK